MVCFLSFPHPDNCFQSTHLNHALMCLCWSQIPLTVWNDIRNSPNSKSAIIQELSAYHQALGGHILPEKHVPKPSIRSSVTSAIARLSSTRPYDLHNQIPNLHPLLTGSVTEPSRVMCVSSELTTSKSEPGTPNSVLPSEVTGTYSVRDLWMWELYSTMKDTVRVYNFLQMILLFVRVFV